MYTNLNPIWEYQKVQEIMGQDENLIKKNYITALEQNPQGYVWIKEVVKNAFEAGSKDFDVRVNTDTENQLVVELLDSGSGVKKDNMYFFFVPRLTSKPRDKDDIN